MGNSASYLAIEAMSLDELEKCLDTFEKKRLISPDERETRLDLARKLNSQTKNVSPS
jgi:hypothetical protein